MKMPQREYDLLRNAMKAVVDYFGMDAIKPLYETNKSTIMWAVYWTASDNLTYDDTHPAFAQQMKPRVHPSVDGWDLYRCGLDDDCIETAIKRICKEIFPA